MPKEIRLKIYKVKLRLGLNYIKLLNRQTYPYGKNYR